MRREGLEFAFTKLMVCGLCGSGISATEKLKKLKDGSFNPHIYYGCTKAKDSNCKCGYINETDLIKQFESLINEVDINETGIRKKIKEDVEKFKKFQQFILGKKEKIVIADIDIRNYAKYVLQEGKDIEKRELLSCLNGKIKFENKKITLV